MSTGRLTLHQGFGPLSGLTDITRVAGDGVEAVYIQDTEGPAFRIAFLLDTTDPDRAISFKVTDPTGTTIYADGDYEVVGLDALDVALAGGDADAASAILFGNLTSIALSDEATAALDTIGPNITLEGNALGTDFTIGNSPATVQAGGGDDTISLVATLEDGHIDGGDGYDRLSFVETDLSTSVYVYVEWRIISVERSGGASQRSFDGIEYFRGGDSVDVFFTNGEGMRFEGGAGGDQFFLSGTGTLRDIVDYGAEAGSLGIIANFGIWDTSDLSGLEPQLRATLIGYLDEEHPDLPAAGLVRDSFGDFDNVGAGLIVEGTTHADFFYGSDGADEFVGDDGDDHFFGDTGDDTIVGGGGDDTFYLASGVDDYTITVVDDSFLIEGSDGIDTVSGVETFSFNGTIVSAASYAPAVPIAADDTNAADAVVEAATGVSGDATASGNVLSNDEPTDGTISVVGARAGESGGFATVGAETSISGVYGTLTVSGSGEWMYELDDDDPDTNALQVGQTAHDIFTYQISDETLVDQAILDIAIAGSNDDAEVGADSFPAWEDTTLTLPPWLFTGNVADPEGETATLISVQGATHGAVSLTDGYVVFNPEAGFHGEATFSYTVQFTLGALLTRQAELTVASVNDAPDGSGSTIAVQEDTTHRFAASDFGFTDPDGNALAAIVIGSLPLHGVLKLGSSAVTAGQVIAVAQLGNLTWTAPTNASGDGLASFTFQARDDGGTANTGQNTDPSPGTIRFDVSAVNDAPSGTSSVIAVREDSVRSFAATDFGFTDPDANAFASIVVGSLPLQGLLKLGSSAVTAGQVIAVSQLGKLTWTPPANASGNALAAFTFKVRDDGGTANGGVNTDPSPATITFDVTPVNDAPNGVGSVIKVREDATHTFATRDFGFSDSDGNTLSAVVIDSLPSSGLLKLGSTAVKAGQVIAALQLGNLTWTPPANAHGAGLASFTFKARDDGGTANGGANTDASAGTVTFDVTSVNDAPGGADSVVTLNEDSTHRFAAGDFGFNDPDGNALGAIVISSLPSQGELRLGANLVTAGQAIGVAQLASLTWTPPANASGKALASFSFKVKDNGGTADGGVDLDPTPARIAFNVSAVNDAPDGAGSVVAMDEDSRYDFSIGDFGFNDIDGDALAEIVITALTRSGQLKLGETAVAVGQVVSAGDLPKLNWTPDADANGDGLDSFTFTVRDDGGTARGGANTDTTAGVISFDVAAVDDRPSLTVASAQAGVISLHEGVSLVSTVSVSDVDSNKVALHLSGADAGAFKLKSGSLKFRTSTDFEAPGDADKDNVYEVNVIAGDDDETAQALHVSIRNVRGNSIAGNSASNLLDNRHRIAGGKYATEEEDKISGKGGADTLKGGRGNDTLIGGKGDDVLTGGRGPDHFVFDYKLGHRNIDLVADFKHNVDVLVLDADIFGAIGPSLAGKEFYSASNATTAHDRNDRVIYDTTTGNLYFDADGNREAHDAILFATLGSQPTLDAGDFRIV